MFDFPNSPTTGQQITGSSGQIYSFDGTKWVAAGSGVVISQGDTPPASPTPGTLWWDSVGGNLYMWYQDPNSSEWVIANTGGIADAPNDTNVYARQSQAWTNVTGASAAAPNNTGRNLVHNPVFTVQQRGTGPWTTTNTYTADRWFLSLNIDAASVSVVTLVDADRTALGDEAAQYALQSVFTGSSTAAAYDYVTQRLENVRRFSNRAVTVSFWAKASSGTPRIGVVLNENFGSGGSPSAAVPTALGTTAALTTTWTRYIVTGTLPSVAGKAFGTTAGSDFAALNIYFSDQANQSATGIGVQSGTVQLWGVQLEYGSVATSLAKRDPADELALCQRFYQQWICGAATSGGLSNAIPAVNLTVAMRATPTLSAPSVSSGSGAAYTVNFPNQIFQSTANSTAAIAWGTASADL